MPAWTGKTRANALTGAYLVILLASCVWVAFGGPVSVLLGVVIVPAGALLINRLSLAATVSVITIALAWGVFVLFVVSRYTGGHALPLLIASAVIVGALGVMGLRRVGSTFRRADAVDLAFAGAGAAVWMATMALARILPDGAPRSWAMMGDAANNVLFARTLLEQGGISLGIGQNPVPLTAGFIALFTVPGTGLEKESVAHEISALAEMWSFGIVAACLLAGLLALALFRSASPLRRIGAAAASLTPLTWIILAGPIGLGFVNFHLTLALLLATLVVLLTSGRTPVLALVVVALALASVLALWTPLAGIPGAALAVMVVVHFRRVVAVRGWKLALVVLALAQPVVVFALLSLPSLIGQGSLLQAANGAVFEIKKWMVAAVAVLALAAGIALARLTRSKELVWLLLALYGGGGSCLALLLWLRRHEANLWSYYQLKFLWLLLAVVLIFAVAAGMALAGAIGPRALASGVVVAVLIVALGTSELAKVTIPAYRNDIQLVRDPIARILTGDFFTAGKGDRVYDEVVALTSGSDRSILWQSSDPDENPIMFWVLQMSSWGVEDFDLRNYAYYHDAQSVDDACAVRRLMGPPVTVITAQQSFAQRIEVACPDLGSVRVMP